MIGPGVQPCRYPGRGEKVVEGLPSIFNGKTEFSGKFRVKGCLPRFCHPFHYDMKCFIQYGGFAHGPFPPYVMFCCGTYL